MTVTLGIVMVALLYYAGAPLRLMAALCGGAAAGALVLAMTASYRMSRIVAFLSPGADTESAGFQSRQALYSLAGGGLFGQGLGQGSAKWDYLPNAHNDFIFAIIGEELGFVGAFAVLALFAHAGLRGPAHRGPQLRPVAQARRGHVHHVARRAGRDQHRLRRGAAPGDRADAPADLLGGHVARGHHVRVRDARQRGAPRAGGDRRAAPPRAGPARPLPAAATAEPYRPVARPPSGARCAVSGSCADNAVPAAISAHERRSRLMNVVVAGGGSAGHIEPALALADAVPRLDPDARVTALGTERGLDTTLIPARGYPLELIPPVPLPRRPSADLLRLPGRVRAAVGRVREVLAEVDADVVVGFGGYVALPAYLGARGRVPIVVHEANARAGLANRVGARFAARVAAAVPGALPDAEIIGIPLRRSITELDRPALAGAGPGAVRAARRRAGAARLRRLAGRAHAQHGARRGAAGPRGGRRSPSCTPTAKRAAPAAPAARLRRAALHRRRWTWPTPPPTPCSAGAGR